MLSQNLLFLISTIALTEVENSSKRVEYMKCQACVLCVFNQEPLALFLGWKLETSNKFHCLVKLIKLITLVPKNTKFFYHQ